MGWTVENFEVAPYFWMGVSFFADTWWALIGYDQSDYQNPNIVYLCLILI